MSLGNYTDDTQMTLALALSLVENNGLKTESVTKKYVGL